MFVRVACLALLQLTFFRGNSVEACSQDSDCSPCRDHNFHAKCSYNTCACHPVHCDPSPCLSTQICVAEPYDYRCRDRCNDQCSGGNTCIITYQGHTKCIDTCVPNPCSSGKHCVHTANAPFYVCHVHPVETVSCRKDSDCHCQGDNFHAICHQDGNGRSHCGGCDPIYCDPNPCPSSQICVVETHHNSSYFRCREHCTENCPVGKTCIKTYQGHRCIDTCVPNPCSSEKTCIHTNQAPFYVCEAFDPCEKHIQCQHGGSCRYDNVHVTCQCRVGYTGQLCEVADPCENHIKCQHSGTCHYNMQCHASCQCPKGFTGQQCEIEDRANDPCNPNPCQSYEDCIRFDNHSQNYECKGNCTYHMHCQHGGHCETTGHPETYRCICPPGFSGIVCESYAVEVCSQVSDCSPCKDPSLQATCATIGGDGHVGPVCHCNPAPNTTQSTSKPTDPPTTKETSTSRTTHPSTTEAASTLSPAPTPTPQQLDCSEFNKTLHGCHDNSACLIPHVLAVICPDPKEAKYCPTKCGCCKSTTII